MISNKFTCTLLVVALGCSIQFAEAGQGCPFDDGSCQEYCNQQGCNMGYCGHFAWIQCICRKCGDEWSWYDKVRYNPDKTVNQTELDSLKLNVTAPIILTTSSNGASPLPSPSPSPAVTVEAATAATAATIKQQQTSSSPTPTTTTTTTATPAPATQERQQQQQTATLTTLLIPDLSDSNKLDLNDIPDENSDKFLDYLAKNHEKLVQATSSATRSSSTQKQQQQQQQQSGDDSTESTDELTTESSGDEESSTPTGSSSGDDSDVEIQISSSNNNNSKQQQATVTTTTGKPTMEQQPEISVLMHQTASGSPITRLIKMAARGGVGNEEEIEFADLPSQQQQTKRDQKQQQQQDEAES